MSFFPFLVIITILSTLSFFSSFFSSEFSKKTPDLFFHISLGVLIFYFALIKALPLSEIIAYKNLSLAQQEKIIVYDPMNDIKGSQDFRDNLLSNSNLLTTRQVEEINYLSNYERNKQKNKEEAQSSFSSFTNWNIWK